VTNYFLHKHGIWVKSNNFFNGAAAKHRWNHDDVVFTLRNEGEGREDFDQPLNLKIPLLVSSTMQIKAALTESEPYKLYRKALKTFTSIAIPTYAAQCELAPRAR
jgi:hypothetical protein